MNLHTYNPQVEKLKFILNGSHMSHFHFYLHLVITLQSHNLQDLALPITPRVRGGKETNRFNTFKINMFSFYRHLLRESYIYTVYDQMSFCGEQVKGNVFLEEVSIMF
jgi:hypothetical protein